MPRQASDAQTVQELLRWLGDEAKGPGCVYLVGGATAVVCGWRDSTIDVDLKLDPEPEGVFDAIARAKEALDINIELAAPDDFIPALPDWRARSRFIVRHGSVDFRHYDFYAQALAKIERAHRQDLDDLAAMMDHKLVQAARLIRLYEAIEPNLKKYPAIDPSSFRAKVERFSVRANLDVRGIV